MKGLKIMGKILLIIILALVALALIALAILKINSSGKLPAIKDSAGNVIEGGVSEKVFVEIGGVKQGMFIRGEKEDNPVLLFLHGGPGSPELAISMAEETGDRLEKEFVVCYWDQRGSGMSYDKDMDPADLNLDRIVEDTAEVTRYLQERFGQEKIYILGHSWGSYLGIKTIERYPEYYRAYLGVGQVVKQTESEKLAYEYMLEHAREIGDEKDEKQLLAYDVNSPDFPQQNYIMGVRSSLMNKYGIGMMHENASMFRIIKNLMLFKGYTIGEKIGYTKGMLLSQQHLFGYVTEDDLFVSSPVVEVPVYILHGYYDYQVSYALAKEYSEKIQAPDKKLYTFENSAHSPLWEEPEAFMNAVQEIMEKTGN